MLATTKILIHSDYGAYGEFSQAFQKTFTEKYGIDIYSITHYNPYLDKKNTNVGIETRYDPRIIDIFEQLGPEKSGVSNGTESMSVRKSSLKIVKNWSFVSIRPQSL